ncbi:hypothetical protein GXW82_30325 [Streptacidiphilus sp. 4-A2]|jgi:hypothetical protein|nr:hypothetical protein [Streptacidiphilus sp. 4-A2]
MKSIATTGISGRRIGRRIGSAVAVLAVATAGLAAGAGTASAKSAITVSAGSHTVSVGRTVQVTATGDSDDFGGTPIQLCLDERVGAGAWQQLHCVSGGWTRVAVRAQHRGELQFRSQLLAVFGPHHRVLDRTSETVSVWAY